MNTLSENEIEEMKSHIRRLKLLCLAWFISIAPSFYPLYFLVESVFLEGFSSSLLIDAILILILAYEVLVILTIIGTLKYTSWGLRLGLILSVISLFGIPLGTFMGIVGLKSYSKTAILFSDKRGIFGKDA